MSWPWPLALLVLGGLVLLVSLVLAQIQRYVAVPAALPIYPGFKERILPLLATVWTLLLGLWFLTGQAFWWAVIPWATVTLLMLWPVGRRFGLPYLTYRRPLFIIGVLSMAYIIGVGFAMQSDWPYPAKLVLFLLLPVDLTLLGLAAALRPAIGRPQPMFFRPDLLFGDGRVLCCGTLAFVLGMRYLVGHPPPEGIPVPIPKWNWWAILYAIAWGFIPLIAVRGVFKVLLRIRRIRDDSWYGWGGVVLRELLLIVSILNIGFGFHHAFKGWSPFVEFHTALHEFSWVPAIGLALAAALLVVVRGAYKRRIGEPFIRETPRQTWVKSALFLAGIFLLMWSWMSILDTEKADILRAGYRHVPAFWEGAHGTGEHVEPHPQVPQWPPGGFILGGMRGVFLGPWNWVGLALLAWGAVMLLPFRVLAQHNQRHALVGQLAAVLLPRFSEDERQKVLAKMQDALLHLPPHLRQSYLQAMNEALADAQADHRAAVTRVFVRLLTTRPEAERHRLMEAMAAALARLPEGVRVRRMADMMAAVAQLPPEPRRAFMATMVSFFQVKEVPR